jgi:Transposase DDE domain
MSELQLTAMFCDIDDFCKRFEPLYTRRLLQSGHRHRCRQTALALSEIRTILVYFHCSHYRTFNHYYPEYVEPHLRPYFPTLVSDTRFVELLPRALVPLCGYLSTRKGHWTGIACIDSTPLAVCHNRRIHAHRVFTGWASRGQTSMGWFYGFKLHLIVNDMGGTLGMLPDTGPRGRSASSAAAHSRALWPALWGPGLYLSGLARCPLCPRASPLDEHPQGPEKSASAPVGQTAAAQTGAD